MMSSCNQMEECLLTREGNGPWLVGGGICGFYVGLSYSTVDLEHKHQAWRLHPVGRQWGVSSKVLPGVSPLGKVCGSGPAKQSCCGGPGYGGETLTPLAWIFKGIGVYRGAPKSGRGTSQTLQKLRSGTWKASPWDQLVPQKTSVIWYTSRSHSTLFIFLCHLCLNSLVTAPIRKDFKRLHF